MKKERVIFAMLVVSVIINVALAHKVRDLNHLFGTTPERLLKSGTSVPSFEAVDLRGEARIVLYNDHPKPTVLYVFTPPCSWCARNMDNFKELVARKGAEYRFIGLSLSREHLPEYVAGHGLTIPIYTGLSAEMQKAYKLGGTPQTIVISPDGRVLQDWMGAYVGDQKSRVEAFFHVSLPGLSAAPEQNSTQHK